MRLVKPTYLLILMFLASLAHSQSYTLAVEAIYPKDQSELVFEPLRNWLEEKTGLTINLINSENYYFYWRSARNDQPDFTLDASHIAAFRMQEKNYLPLARFREDISYHLISNNEPANDQSIGEFLVGKGVVTLPNPNMGSILFDQWFTDLFLQPKKIVSALSWEDVIEQVFDQTANAAIIPSALFNLYPNFLSLKESQKMPGMTFLASPSVDPGVRKTVQNALLSIGKDEGSLDILIELNSEGFTEVDTSAYKDLAKKLKKLLM